MNKEETLALYAQGRDAWNAWAEGMLAGRKALEKAGEWALERDGTGANQATERWLKEATADFKGQVFVYSAGSGNFERFLFPGPTDFKNAEFKENARFVSARFGSVADFGDTTFHFVTFEGARFDCQAKFDRATFSGQAGFDDARFKGRAEFATATFGSDAFFNGATFGSDAGFVSTRFGGSAFFDGAKFRFARFNEVKFISEADVVFTNATFTSAGFSGATFGGIAMFTNATFGGANFEGAKFGSDAWFADVTFRRNASFNCTWEDKRCVTFEGQAVFEGARFGRMAGFEGAHFNGPTRFTNTTFKDRTTFADTAFAESASFVAIDVQRFFTIQDVEFDKVPDFTQAHFAEAPLLDEVKVRLDEYGASVRYRSLKRLAIQGHDHSHELDFFAAELTALRGFPDRLGPNPFNWFRKDEEGKRLPVWPGGARGTVRYWTGLIYQGLSDFGRSIVRPIAWLSGAFLLFAWLYWTQAAGTPACAARSWEQGQAAFWLSLHRALPITGLGVADKLSESYACLYGLNTRVTPNMPTIPNAVALLGVLQSLISLVLIFLMLLAIRNHFRIR